MELTHLVVPAWNSPGKALVKDVTTGKFLTDIEGIPQVMSERSAIEVSKAFNSERTD